jgi:arylsulfatase A-like enzyme
LAELIKRGEFLVPKRPNVVFVFGDQHRFCDVGYNGNSQVKTSFLDKLKFLGERIGQCHKTIV